jgi:hypothetical protein
MKTLFKETGMLPEIFLKISQSGLKSFVHLQQQWLQRAGKVQESTKSYTFENIDEDAVDESLLDLKCIVATRMIKREF